MIKLGYSSSGDHDPIKERIKFLLSVGTDAIELGYVTATRLSEKLHNEDIENIKRFNYKSIHAPVLLFKNEDKKEFVRYPSKDTEVFLNQILKIAKLIDVDTILIHPDLVDDFDWLNKLLGNKLAFENMDDRKDFGKTVKDLEEIYKKAPLAKWVCDVNHIYTIDKSMQLADPLHEAFQDRLCHYHISSYGGFHDCFHITHENKILEGIRDFSKPLIHEGGVLRDGMNSLNKEHDYLTDKLDRI